MTCLAGHMIDRLRLPLRRQLFPLRLPQQTNMAGPEERRNLLGDEDEGSVSGKETARKMPAICDPSHLLHRVVVLMFMCFLGFGECLT